MLKVDFNESQIWLSKKQTSVYIGINCTKGYMFGIYKRSYYSDYDPNKKYTEALLKMKRNDNK